MGLLESLRGVWQSFARTERAQREQATELRRIAAALERIAAALEAGTSGGGQGEKDE